MLDSIKSFIKYVSKLDGDEKGEAQVFCDPGFATSLLSFVIGLLFHDPYLIGYSCLDYCQ
tara:strand:+ start:226 stop:405 length:180 start_codon:yes stop_codon:yes gene_type:complete